MTRREKTLRAALQAVRRIVAGKRRLGAARCAMIRVIASGALKRRRRM